MNDKRSVTLLIATTLSFMATMVPAWARPARNSYVAQEVPEEKTLIGMVTDSKCKGRIDRKAVTLSSCARQCVHAEGAYYVLLVGNVLYVLDGYSSRDVTSVVEARREAQIMHDLDNFAGGRAAITGKVSGDHILVQSVTAAKKH